MMVGRLCSTLMVIGVWQGLECFLSRVFNEMRLKRCMMVRDRVASRRQDNRGGKSKK